MRNSIILWICLVSITCIRSPKKEILVDVDPIKEINKHFNIQSTSGKSVYLLIPLGGCSICIEPAIHFAKQNINEANLIFIVSDFGIKPIQIEFGAKEIEAYNIFPDTDGFLYQLEVVFNNPVVFFVENRKIQIEVVLSAQNSKGTFKKIADFLE